MATDNIGVELLAATPFRHKGWYRANRHHRHRPSVATHPDGAVVLWRCAKQGAPVRGAGINYTTFFNEDFNDNGKAAGLSDLSLKDSWGAAGQVGLDYLINRDWLLNMSVWYIRISIPM